MNRVAFTVLGLMVLVGCARAAMPIRLNPAGVTEVPCVDRLLAKSRMTGYVEQTVDKEAGFFRVVAKSRERRVSWFNVQCMPDGSALVTPVSSTQGAATDERGFRISGRQQREMSSYAAQLDSF